jgi:putative component of toxin-antitoxin plasmid stabilization module
MKRIQTTTQFTKWLDRLKDVSGRARIQIRIQRLAIRESTGILSMGFGT